MLRGKVIAVTGAGGGIGREIALLAAAEGAAVVVNDVTTAAVDVVDEIRAAGGEAVANSADISKPVEAATVIADAVQTFGRIDGVVNNAGIVRDRIFHKMDVADWDRLVAVNLNGYFYVSRAAAEQFRTQNYGSFVHLTSTSGLVGNLGQANYSAAKMGIVGLSRSIAIDMAPFGVTSNCLAPFAWSGMTATIAADTPEDEARVARFKSMSPAKIAPLAIALLSDAAREITGQIFGVRKNEIFLMSQSRPIRSMHRSDGWTPENVSTELFAAFASNFYALEQTRDVFAWEPI